ncbi:DNA ligase [Rubrivivax sp. A210]|uniref:DNA ligase n=1 Tax=Rubrivivax sp. A210 TaxID=2772301 RepID=UPI00191B7781|nr:DNA ligase [Rubrivivax sp. A210]CAD5373690.1 DNA ligase [Rubrivivax sp. A210]
MKPDRRRFLAALSALSTLPAWPAWARPASDDASPPRLLLALEAAPDVDPAGWLVSEKYDGVRAFWDGRALRLRSGTPVAAPAWFTARLPATPLDGELWLGPGRFDALSAAVRRARPVDAEWRALRYMVFELPDAAGDFASRAARIASLLQATGNPQLVAVHQAALVDRAALQARLAQVVGTGGEGLMLHRADAPYSSGRSPLLLKLKPVQDEEATVVGHVAGRGRHEGRLGALRVRMADGAEFLIGTGFSDAQRESPPPLGALVSYRYRGRTAGGLPRFASFLRLRDL